MVLRGVNWHFYRDACAIDKGCVYVVMWTCSRIDVVFIGR